MADWSELEQLAAAATKGVWEVDPEEIISPHSGAVLGVYIRHQKKGGRIAEFFANCLVKTDEQCRANARFAAAANPSAIRALITENKRLAAVRDQLRTEVKVLRKDAERYRWLRNRDLDTIHLGGIFAGMTPENVVVNGKSLDQAIDASMNKEVAHG